MVTNIITEDDAVTASKRLNCKTVL